LDFIKVRKKRSFKERIRMICDMLNKNGEVSQRDLVVGWGITPHYAKTLLQWAVEFYSYAKYDDTFRVLYIPERKPLYAEVSSKKEVSK